MCQSTMSNYMSYIPVNLSVTIASISTLITTRASSKPSIWNSKPSCLCSAIIANSYLLQIIEIQQNYHCSSADQSNYDDATAPTLLTLHGTKLTFWPAMCNPSDRASFIIRPMVLALIPGKTEYVPSVWKDGREVAHRANRHGGTAIVSSSCVFEG